MYDSNDRLSDIVFKKKKKFFHHRYASSQTSGTPNPASRPRNHPMSSRNCAKTEKHSRPTVYIEQYSYYPPLHIILRTTHVLFLHGRTRISQTASSARVTSDSHFYTTYHTEVLLVYGISTIMASQQQRHEQKQRQQHQQGGGVSLGKGAWDVDANREIPPEREAVVFEETPTFEFAFNGLPTIPPRRDNDHLSFFCGGCRYRVRASVFDTVRDTKRRLWEGGLGRGGDMNTGKRKVIERWEDVVLVFAGKRMVEDEKALSEYGVPPGCKCLVAIDKRLLQPGNKPDADSAYWN